MDLRNVLSLIQTYNTSTGTQFYVLCFTYFTLFLPLVFLSPFCPLFHPMLSRHAYVIPISVSETEAHVRASQAACSSVKSLQDRLVELSPVFFWTDLFLAGRSCWKLG